MPTTSDYRWRTDTKPQLLRKTEYATRGFPSTGVIGEIKPHNDAGIAAGIRQLRGRRGRTTHTLQLITYRQVPGQPTQYEVLAADPRELRKVVEGGGSKISSWLKLGRVQSAKAAEMIPLWQCSPRLGNLLEKPIRQLYARRIGATLDPKASASQTGADISHELLEMAEFLRELATELESEAGYPQS